jgi:hypothetical protein
MQKVFIFLLFIVLSSSCSYKNDIGPDVDNPSSVSRSACDMDVSLALSSGQSVLLASVDKAIISGVNGQSFSVLINPNAIDQVSYSSVVSLSVSHCNNGMSLIKNPGENQSKYQYLGLINVVPYGSNALQYSAAPIDLIGYGSSIIIEEMSGLAP